MKQVNEAEDFLELVINCHLIAAAMHFFSMTTTSDEPRSTSFPSNISHDTTVKRCYLKDWEELWIGM